MFPSLIFINKPSDLQILLNNCEQIGLIDVFRFSFLFVFFAWNSLVRQYVKPFGWVKLMINLIIDLDWIEDHLTINVDSDICFEMLAIYGEKRRKANITFYSDIWMYRRKWAFEVAFFPVIFNTPLKGSKMSLWGFYFSHILSISFS